jgi:AcrR family transcriptional regulator
MPPKVSFSSKRILDCAFAIVRKDGLAALSTRRIAHELQCSTRPVYGSFKSMEDLQDAVIQQARGFALEFFQKEEKETESPFLSMGLQYYRFSREEPELFRMLYMEGQMGDSFENLGRHFEPLLKRAKLDPRLSGLSEARLKRLGADSWIYTHGLVALVHVLRPQNAEQIVRARLSEMGRMFLELGSDPRKDA